MAFEQETFSITNAYAPQLGLKEHEKIKIQEDLKGLVQEISLLEKNIFGENLNGHIKKEVGQYVRFHGGIGIRKLNKERKSILDFSMAYDFQDYEYLF